MGSATLFGQFREIRRGEWGRSLLLSSYFFLVIATFWVLKPLKRGLLIHYFSNRPIELFGLQFDGAESEQIAKFMNMICALAIAVIFPFFVRRFPRHKLVWVSSVLFAGAFVAFAAAISRPSELVAWSFYIFGDMFNTVMVVLFWAFTDDLSTSDGAKRTYGLIGLGGVLGGFAGATVVESTVKDLSRAPLLLMCVVPMLLISAIAFRIARASRRSIREQPRVQRPQVSRFEGARLVMRSRYLLAIAGLVCVYEITSNVVDFQLATVVERQISDSLGKDAFFASVGQLTGIASIFVQLFLTGFVMTKFGLRPALLLLPLSMAAGSVGFLVTPTLLFAAFLSASDNALNYSINQSAKEVLYAPTPPEVTYNAKAFIDMFIQRFAKALSVVLNLTFAALAIGGVRWLSLVVLSLAVIWIVLVFIASRDFKTVARSERQNKSMGEMELAGQRL